MKDLFERAGYLKGLLENMTQADEETKRFLEATADMLSDIAVHMSETQEMMVDLNDYLEKIDDDLAAIEDERDEMNDDDDGFELGYASMDDFEDIDETEDTIARHGSPKGDIALFPRRREEEETEAEQETDESEFLLVRCPICDALFRMLHPMLCTCPGCRRKVLPQIVDVDELPFVPEDAE